jgi:hypothetical protein
MVCEYIYAKASPRHIMSQSGRKVSERSTKPPGFTIPCYFYMYNISSDDFAVIQTIRAEIYLFTMGTPYKINSRTLVLASSGEGFYHSNLPPPRRSAANYHPYNVATNKGRPQICYLSAMRLVSN